MIPVRLQMRNFMCYAEQVPPLDFSGMQLACLAGDNGHGKSALIDAITWAIWGKARSQRDDDLIHLGSTDMQVEFEFMLAGNLYRVIRQRRRNGTRGRTTLEFQIGDDGRFRSLTGNTIRQTQATINQTLRMDYDTFINSALLLQGRADEFTTTPPAERKRILGDILGLSLYDRLEQGAKEKGREIEVKLREIAAGLGEIEKELSRKGEYELELQEAESAAAQVSERLRTEETRLGELREATKELNLKREQLRELAMQLEGQQEELAQTSEVVSESQKRISSYQTVLTNAEDIDNGYVSLVAARRENEELTRKLTEHSRLNQARSALQRSVDEARNRILLERELCAQRVSTLKTQAQEIGNLEGKLGQLHIQLQQLSETEEEKERMDREEERLSTQAAGLRTANEQLKSDMELLKDKLDLLEEAEATCPLCGTLLEAGERDHIRAEYATEGREKGDQYRSNSATIQALTRSIEETREARKAIEAGLAELASLQRQDATLQKSLDEALAAREDLDEAARQLAEVDERLANGDFARAQSAELDHLDEQLANLGYAADKHEEIRKRVSTLAHFEQPKAELETARHSLTVETERLQQLEKSLERIQEALADGEKRQQDLHAQIGALEVTTARLDDQSQLVDDLQAKESLARLRLGAATQKLNHCLHLEKEKQARLLALREAKEQKALYDELRVAFGKKGIQAMIIEAAIPEIEEEANRLLSRMTEGRMHIRFKSQRETLKGETIETLDIEVSDELGPRSYDLFSGGEAFRIDFAIRIALSKLLSRRAGASLQTLIIDEGFGTQDARGKERLVEAINSVQEDFARILVITHIEELKNAFPARIDVFKTPQGSQIAIR